MKKGNFHVSEGLALTEAQATEKVLAKCAPETARQLRAANGGRGALFIRIVNVSHGKSTTVRDPHGIDWQVFNPLGQVGFYNPKDKWPDLVPPPQPRPPPRRRRHRLPDSHLVERL